ncbi:MAG: VanZ family protein [Cyanobacteria bacterium P01_A01_bin.83]
MNNYTKKIKILKKTSKNACQSWEIWLVLSNIIVIVIATLSPFKFIERDHLYLMMMLKGFFRPNSDIYDVIANILLFLPFGFGFGKIFQQRFSSNLVLLTISLLLSTTVSLIVETLQIYLPTRTPNFIDLLSNILGGVLGTVIWFCCQFIWRYFQLLDLSKNKLLFVTLSYASLIFCLMISLPRTHNFSNWNPNFPLLIGNEQTGDRPWRGRIKQVYFATHSLSEQEIAQTFTKEQPRATTPWFTGYQLTGNSDYPDQNERSPNLEWQEVPPTKKNEGMISLSQQHWLLTPEPATKLNQAIQQTSQFSLLTTVATRDIHQTGPARIISLSASPFRRNLTIGQQGSGVIVRLRTPLSGLGATNTNLTFPNILGDTKPHQLLFNFDGKTLQLFVDRPSEVYTLNLSPEVLFFHFLPAIGIRGFQITPTNKWMLQLAFYGLMLVPPAALVVLFKFNHITPENTA